MAVSISPQDVPEVRTDILDWITSPFPRSMWRVAGRAGNYDWLAEYGLLHPDSPAHVKGELVHSAQVEIISNAELFYISADMLDLISAAAPTIPDFGIEPHDLPSPYGLAVFEKSPLHLGAAGVVDVTGSKVDEEAVGVRAVSWGAPRAGIDFNVISLYADRDDWAPLLAKHTTTRKPYSEPKLGYLHGNEAVWGYGSYVDESRDDVLDRLRFIRAMWLLMRQGNLAERSEAHPSRASQKRMRRAGYESKPVRVISLRRGSGGGDGQSGRAYQNRWVVRGHWRKIRDGEDGHRFVWIAPYVKGPEGAPLLGGEKVHTLR